MNTYFSFENRNVVAYMKRMKGRGNSIKRIHTFGRSILNASISIITIVHGMYRIIVSKIALPHQYVSLEAPLIIY